MLKGSRTGFFVCVLTAGLLLMGSEQTLGRQKAAKSDLEGTWDGVQSIGGGKTRAFAADEMWVTFRGDVVVGKKFLAPEGVERRFEVDANTSPKHFDFIQAEGPPLRGIYRVDGDALMIAISFTSTRPNGFKESDQPFRVSILELKRRK